MAKILGIDPTTCARTYATGILPGEVQLWAESVTATHWIRLSPDAARELAAALVAAADDAEGGGNGN